MAGCCFRCCCQRFCRCVFSAGMSEPEPVSCAPVSCAQMSEPVSCAPVSYGPVLRTPVPCASAPCPSEPPGPGMSEPEPSCAPVSCGPVLCTPVSCAPVSCGPVLRTPDLCPSGLLSSELRRPEMTESRGPLAAATVAGITVVDRTHSRGGNARPITMPDDPTVVDTTPAPLIGENANLEELIKYIKQLLQLITAGKGSSRQKAGWPTSSSFCKLKKFLSEGITDFNDTNPDQRSSFAKTIVQTILKEIGHAQWITAGLLVVADILERFETVSSNRSECLTLLDEMTTLAEYVMVLQERPGLREGMQNTIKEAIELIVEASLMCSTQIDPSKFSRFFLTPINKEELGKFGQQLHAKYKQINVDLDISVTANKRNRWREYPDHAVGIEESVGEVIDLLECESENNAVAVILHGRGGIGKTTLADAVFSRIHIHIENCKYSMVEILEKIDSTSKIINLQKMILRDLIDSEEPIPDIRKYEDGQRELSLALEKVPAFICIDNVLCQEELQNILPKDLKNARKIRLLLTTRDINVRRACRMKTKMYSMEGLPDTAAMCLLKKEMYDGIHHAEDQINPSQLQQLIEICKGVPQQLSLIAGIIRCEGDKQSAYSKAMEVMEKK